MGSVILFDLGGTLATDNVDRVLLQPQGLSTLAACCGAVAPETLAETVRSTYETYHRAAFATCREEPLVRILERALAALGEPPEKAPNLEDAYYREAYHRIGRAPFALEEVSALHAGGYRLGIVSNGAYSPAFTEELLRRLDLDRYFPVITVSSASRSRKPDAGILLDTLALFGATAQESVYVGNTRSRDVLASRRAGMQSILVSCKEPPGTAGVEPDLELPTLEGLAAAVQQLRSGR